MDERGQHAAFAEEALRLGAAGEVRVEHLHGDRPVEQPVAREQDRAHAAGRHRALDRIAAGEHRAGTDVGGVGGARLFGRLAGGIAVRRVAGLAGHGFQPGPKP